MAEKSRSEPDRREPIRVLLVEDVEHEAELTCFHLKRHGIAHVVQRVETDDAMRTALREFRPTIILSDFSLPAFDGLRALEVAREVAPDVPFLFVSGTIGEERAIEALRRGAVDYKERCRTPKPARCAAVRSNRSAASPACCAC
jgi:DNA-binding response OmpR family regulator